MDYETVIKRVLQKLDDERKEVDDREEVRGGKLPRTEMSGVEQELSYYLSLLRQSQESRSFALSKQEGYALFGKDTTLLMCAASLGEIDVVEDLLATGVDVNEKNELGMTALAYAALKHRVDIVEKLLIAGADMEAKDEMFGWTALAMALSMCQHCRVADKYIDTVRILLYAGADVNAKDNFGYPVWNYAGDPHLLRLFLSFESLVDINAQDDKGRTRLMRAASRSFYEDIQVLLREGADANIKDNEGRTALMLAIQSEEPLGYLATIEELLSFGRTDVHAKDNEGNTALSLATRLTVIELLREAGAEEQATP